MKFINSLAVSVGGTFFLPSFWPGISCTSCVFVSSTMEHKNRTTPPIGSKFSIGFLRVPVSRFTYRQRIIVGCQQNTSRQPPLRNSGLNINRQREENVRSVEPALTEWSTDWLNGRLVDWQRDARSSLLRVYAGEPLRSFFFLSVCV